MVPGTVRVGGSHQTKAPRELDPDSSGTPHLASFSGHVKMQTALEVPKIQTNILQMRGGTAMSLPNMCLKFQWIPPDSIQGNEFLG